ncbi:outer membrane beta-barrel protein [Paracoccus sp. PAR01]|uniref:outer membrane beta-barrel protein n=1 Tax=Paracoccus sp. PAR01 TaxID=2769282 RepID=UPI0017815B6E|nr:outer membrane beta-barrel protein [Paracoccus sp. PAR01]MBD9528863.1 outer membrane beta-barrel protein [Paracoccus sp. PAR01]
MTKFAILLLGLISANGAAAQDADWTYKATIYGWFPGMSSSVDTRFGTVEADSSSSDALSDLDMAFMGSFSAQYGRWAFIGDLLYSDLSSSQDTPFALYGDGTVDVKTTAISGYVLYRVVENPQMLLDLGAGFRHFDVDVDVALSPGRRPAASQSFNGSWTDPLIAARLSVPINDNWFLSGFADWGGSGGDDETWQIYAGVGYAFDEKWSTQFGYRHMEISRELDGPDMSIGMGGPVLALTYNF